MGFGAVNLSSGQLSLRGLTWGDPGWSTTSPSQVGRRQMDRWTQHPSPALCPSQKAEGLKGKEECSVKPECSALTSYHDSSHARDCLGTWRVIHGNWGEVAHGDLKAAPRT